ncbi:hypothetical protein HNP52_002853 [Sphingomonas kyeonggiensis]|uniref:EpsG family protein n=1 Tax=Sphingomonas kyeonggiensis TaxID=1268553 RepID=A0A7W7K2G8_9SPHN|nr:EpsG family protein [Sphingomonas kyeonggiensis]MBB4839784.1 hypothetical protein [Sphingomonas kyeonggiensis]
MTLAYIVYFGLIISLALVWQLPRWYATTSGGFSQSGANIASLITVVLVTVVIGFRYAVGGDFFGYIDYYTYTTMYDTPSTVYFEPGFLYLIQFLKLFSFPPQAIIAATTCVQCILLVAWLRKRVDLAALVIFYIFSTLLIFEVNSTIRQGVAFFAILVALDAINRRNLFLFGAMIFLAFLFHRSAIVFFPIGLMLWRVSLPPVSLQLGGLMLAYFMTQLFSDQVIFLFSYLAPMLDYTSYGRTSRSDLLLTGGYDSYGIAAFFWMIVDIILILFSRRTAARWADQGYARYHYLFLVAAILTPVNTSWGFIPFARALFYFNGMRAICLAFLTADLLSRRSLRDASFAAALLVMFTAWLVVGIARGAAWASPYQFAF